MGAAAELLGANLRDEAALVRVLEVRAVLHHLADPALVDRGLGEEIDARIPIVVVPHDVALRQRARPQIDAHHPVDVMRARPHLHADLGDALDLGEGRVAVAEYEHVGAAGAVDEVEDPEVLAEPRDEGEIRLSILHDELARRVAAFEPAHVEVLARLEPRPLQTLLHRLGHRQIHEDVERLAHVRAVRARNEAERHARLVRRLVDRVVHLRHEAREAMDLLITEGVDELRRR